MKYTEAIIGTGTMYGIARLELTRRNLETLLEKLADPLSQRTLIDGDRKIAVVAVENDAHYKDRAAGEVYMPSTGEIK